MNMENEAFINSTHCEACGSKAHICFNCKSYRPTVFDCSIDCPVCGGEDGLWFGYCRNPLYFSIFGENKRKSNETCDEWNDKKE